MTLIHVPFHQDEPLSDDHLPGLPEVTVSPGLPDGDTFARMRHLHRAVADAVAAHPDPVVMSGDCLVSLGILKGLQDAGVDAGIVWFDAHGDVHTLASSTSGYLGGMALRFAVGGDAERVAQPLGLRPLPEDRAVLVDARDLDPAEAAFLAGSAIRRIDVSDVADAVLPTGPLVLHVDLDVIDPDEVPGLLYPAPGGPSSSAVLDAIAAVRATGRVVATHLSCPWHPPQTADIPRRTELVRTLVDSAGR